MAHQGINGGGSLKSTSINGVKMYSVTSQNRSLATWLNPKKLKALHYLQRVDLIQDLRFETATTRIKATPDGEFLIASGIYSPQVKVYELRELSLKFERHLVSEIINFEVLGDDYSKIAFLCADRSIQLHAKYGSHYSLRIPRMGRDIAYDSWSCDLIAAASSPELYGINLEQGRFLSSLTTQSPAVNVVCRSKVHGLVASGGEDGAVECFDMRTRYSVGRINAVGPAGDMEQVTALQFDGDGGYHMAVGSSAGKIKRKLPKVNRALFVRLIDVEDETERMDVNVTNIKKKSKKNKGLPVKVMKDDRFSIMLKNEDFEFDEDAPEYRALHPIAATAQPSLVEEHFEPVTEDEDQSLSDSDGEKSRVPGFYEVKDDRHADAFWNNVSLAREDALPLGERVAALFKVRQGSGNVKSGPGGSREISFIPRSSAKYIDDDEDHDTRRDRRGVQSLKTQPDGYSSRGRGRGGSCGRGGRGRGENRGRGRGGARGRGRR